MEPGQRAALLAAKLGALVREGFPGRRVTPAPFPGGAGVVGDGVAFLLLDANPERAMGGALAWSDKQHVTEVHLIADTATGVLARRAEAFDPAPTIWGVDGRVLVAAEVEPVEPVLAPPDAPELAEVLIDAGLEVVVEGGAILGEVLGLEVVRIEMEEGRPQLRVGVGRLDQEASELMHGDLAPSAAVERVTAIVREQRRVGAEPHPLNQLVPERWLRAALIAAPSAIGLSDLRAAPMPVPRANLREKGLAAAVGHDAARSPVVVVTSVGIDLEHVPQGADARAWLDPDAELILVMPERDDHPVTHALAARLRRPARIIPVSGDWRTP